MKADQDSQTNAIIGAAMTVHRELGCGFLEAVFQEAFEPELAALGIPHRREVHLHVFIPRNVYSVLAAAKKEKST
ncbi:MAG: GxxExxY protein [Verrucomicrobiae bacterium]|nr:GxxExxY protein [Verrucomicrobiae bacterium]